MGTIEFEVVSLGPDGYLLRLEGGVIGGLRLLPNGRVVGAWKYLDTPVGRKHLVRRPESATWVDRHLIDQLVPEIDRADVIRAFVQILRAAEADPAGFWQIRISGNSSLWLKGDCGFAWTDFEMLAYEPDFYDQIASVRGISNVRRDLLLEYIPVIRRHISG